MKELIELEDGGLVQKLKEGFNYQIVDSTALMAVTTPFFAALETFAAGMSDKHSINARLLAVGLTYAGMGRLFSKGLDASRGLFNIKPETKERLKQIHDASYAATYNLVMTPAFYYASGLRDAKKIAIGTLIATGLVSIIGGPMGYVVDAFRDLTGLKKSERLPNLLERQSPKLKKCFVGLLIAGSIAATTGIYSLTPDRQDYSTQTPTAIGQQDSG